MENKKQRVREGKRGGARGRVNNREMANSQSVERGRGRKRREERPRRPIFSKLHSGSNLTGVTGLLDGVGLRIGRLRGPGQKEATL